MAEKMMNNINSFEHLPEQQTTPAPVTKHAQNKIIQQPQINANDLQKFTFKNNPNIPNV